MKVKVLRLLEYTYESAEEAARDQQRWAVQNTTTFNGLTVIRSAVLSPDFQGPPAEPERYVPF